LNDHRRSWLLLAWVAIVLGTLASLATQVVHLRTYLDPEVASFCTAGRRFDCTTVSLSPYAVFLGLPLPVWGLASFLAQGIALGRRSMLLLPLASVAAAASVGLLVVELRLLRTVCLLCEGVHVATWILLGAAVRLRPALRPPTRGDALAVFLPAAAIVAAIGLFAPRYWDVTSTDFSLEHRTGIDEGGRPWIGAEDPSFVIEEYLHYGCPHCRVAMVRTRRWLESRGDRIRFVRHHQPLSRCLNPKHCQPLRVALCAEDAGKFWQADGWLFTHATGKSEVDARAAARALDLDVEAFVRCVDATETLERADRHADEAFEAGRTVTPSYFVGGQELSLKEVEQLLEAN
jgi:uncharacterized membrane protein